MAELPTAPRPLFWYGRAPGVIRKRDVRDFPLVTKAHVWLLFGGRLGSTRERKSKFCK